MDNGRWEHIPSLERIEKLATTRTRVPACVERVVLSYFNIARLVQPNEKVLEGEGGVDDNTPTFNN